MTRWSRSFITLLENGERGADGSCLIDLARAMKLDPLTFLHAAYRDQLAASGSTNVPKFDAPTVALDCFSARQLQERHLPFSVGEMLHIGDVALGGSLLLDRQYLRCRPRSFGRPVNEILMQERVVGGPTREYDGDVLEILEKPEHLNVHPDTAPEGEWVRHRVVFPSGWPRAESAAHDQVSFSYRRRFHEAYVEDPREYVKQFNIESLDQAFVGKYTFYLVNLVERLQIKWKLPRQSSASSWRLRIWWGQKGNERDDLEPEGVCRSMQFKHSETTATVVLERPLAGYTFSLQWIPASLERYLNESKRRG